jgi:hypothetical protein
VQVVALRVDGAGSEEAVILQLADLQHGGDRDAGNDERCGGVALIAEVKLQLVRAAALRHHGQLVQAFHGVDLRSRLCEVRR